MPLGVTPEEEAKARRVVEESKRTAHVDTGRLKKSISTKVNRGKIVFRQYFYGIYNDNSDLERNAKRIMGNIPYTIELLDEDGSSKTIQNYRSGRLSNQTAKSKDKAKKKKVNKANELIKRVLAKRKKDGESDKSDKDN